MTPAREAALEQLYAFRRLDPRPQLGDPSFDEFVYLWLDMPSPSPTSDAFDEYDVMWWSTFGYVFRHPRALIPHFERLDDPRAKRLIAFARHVAAADVPTDQGAKVYYMSFAQTPCAELRELLNVPSPWVLQGDGGSPTDFFGLWRQIHDDTP